MVSENQREPEYVGFWLRVWASVIDSTLILLVVGPILYLEYGKEFFYREDLLAGWIDFLATQVFPSLAVIIFWIYRSATPGKMIVLAKIVDARSGGKPSVKQCIIRYFAYFISSIPLFLGILWVGWDKRKQGWHDKLAGTLVIRLDPDSSGDVPVVPGVRLRSNKP